MTLRMPFAGRLFLAVALVVLAALPASAATLTWSNAAGGNWSTASNWSPAGVPATGDAVTLPALGGAYAVTMDVNASIAGLSIGSGATLQMATGDSLTFTGTAIQNDGILVIGPSAGNALRVSNTSDTLQVSGSGSIQLQGSGHILSGLSMPSLHYWMVNGAGHTLSGVGDIYLPVINRGAIVQSGGGTLHLDQYLTNSGSISVSNGGRVNARYGLKSLGGTVTGHNGQFTCIAVDRPDLYAYMSIDNLNGGSFTADGGDLDIRASVVAGGIIYQTGGSGVVGFHDTGNPNNLVVTAGAEMLLEGGTGFHIDTNSFENHGTVHVQGTLWLGGSLSDTVATSSDGVINLQNGTIMGGRNMAGQSQWLLNAGTITGCGTIDGNFINTGTIDIDCPTLEASVLAQRFINRGRIQVTRGYVHFKGNTSQVRNIGVISGHSGGILIDQGATLQNTGGILLAGRSNVTLGRQSSAATIVGGTLGATNGGYFANTGQATLQDVTLGTGSTFYTANRAVTTATGASLVNRGTNAVQAGGAFVAGGTTDYVQPEGVTLMQGGTLTVPRGFTVQGALRGAGTIVGKVINAGELSPAASATGLAIQGDYVQEKSGRLALGVGGYAPEQFSHLSVTGHATLDGSVTMSTTGGFQPQVGRVFNVMAFAARSGEFSAIDAAPGLQLNALYEDVSLSLQTSSPLSVGGPSLPRSMRFYGRAMGFGLDLPQMAEVTVHAYDVTGRQVAVLASGVLPAGVHGFELGGRGLASGVYFARATLRTDSRSEVREARVIVLR